MPRTVVPPAPAAADGLDIANSRNEQTDDIPTKLVKYIPGETLGFLVPTAAMVGDERDSLLLAVAAIGAIGNLAWLFHRAPTEKGLQPKKHFYILSLLAYAAWALATAPNLANIFSLDTVETGVALAVAVFLIPVTDSGLNRRK